MGSLSTSLYDGVIKGNIFHLTGALWGESIGHRWITLIKASHWELWCSLWPWTTVWANSQDSGDLRRHGARYDVIVMWTCVTGVFPSQSVFAISQLKCGIWSWHYNDVIMSAMASQITSLTIVYSTVYSGADQRKHQNSASLAFARVIHRGPVTSPHKGPVTWKMFPFDDVIMNCWIAEIHSHTGWVVLWTVLWQSARGWDISFCLNVTIMWSSVVLTFNILQILYP